MFGIAICSSIRDSGPIAKFIVYERPEQPRVRTPSLIPLAGGSCDEHKSKMRLAAPAVINNGAFAGCLRVGVVVVVVVVAVVGVAGRCGASLTSLLLLLPETEDKLRLNERTCCIVI